MAIIPPSLRPPERFPSQLRPPTPKPVQPVSPEYEVQLKQQQQTIVKIEENLQRAKQELAAHQKGWDEYVGIKSSSYQTTWYARKDGIAAKIYALEEAQRIAQTGFVEWKAIATYVSLAERGAEKGTLSALRWQEKVQEQRLELKEIPPEIIKPELIPAEVPKGIYEQQLETFKRAGYTPKQAEILATWSFQHQQSPSPSKQKQIIAEVELQRRLGITPMVDVFKPKPVGVIQTFEAVEMPEIPRRETISLYTQPTILPIDRGEPMGFPSFLQRAIQYVPEKVEEALFEEREPTPRELFAYGPTISAIPRKETIAYTPIEELSPKWELERKRIIEEFTAETLFEIEAKEEVNKIYNKYLSQIQVEGRTITSKEDFNKLVKSTQQQASRETDIKIKELEEKYVGEFTKREEGRIKKYEDRLFSEGHLTRFLRGVVKGGFYVIPYYGTALLGVDIATGIKEAPSTIAAFKEAPLRRGIETVEYGLGMAAVGIGVARTKAMVRRQKIETAIRNAEIRIKSKGILSESNINALKISAEGKLKLKNLMKKGGAVRGYDVSLKAAPSQIKHTPKVSGTFIEVLDQTGNVIDRVGAGTLQATLKGKTINQALFHQAILKIDTKAGGVSGYSEVVAVRIRRRLRLPTTIKEEFVKPRKYKIIEESKIVFDKPFAGKRIVATESTARLLEVVKYRGEELLIPYTTKGPIKVLPDIEFLKRKAKPYVKAVAIEKITPAELILDVRTIGDVGIAGVMKRYLTEGRAIAKRVKPEVKPKKVISRAMRGFDDTPEPSFVYKPLPPPKPKIPKVKEVPPLPVQSLFYGKRIAVPSYLAPVEVGIGRLPGTLAGKGFGGLISGVGVLKPIVKPEIRVKVITEEALKPEVVEVGMLRDLTRIREEELLVHKPILVPPRAEAITREETIIKEQLRQPQITKVKVVQLQRRLQKLRLERAEITVPAFPTITPTIFPPIIFPAEVEYIKGKRIGYETHVKSRGRYKKVSVKPMTKSAAQDLGARIVDNTVSAMFKIEPIIQTKVIKGKKKQMPKMFAGEELQKGDNYFLMTINKFRDFMVRRGRKVQMKNKWIEKKEKRIDTRGEAQGLTVSQWQARGRKRALGLPVRRTKKRKGGIGRYFGF